MNPEMKMKMSNRSHFCFLTFDRSAKFTSFSTT